MELPLNISKNLIDAKQASINSPSTFDYPERYIKSLVPGNFVKICHNEERFWVELLDVDGDELSGRIDNDLVMPQPFKCDDLITFEKRHIYQVLQR